MFIDVDQEIVAIAKQQMLLVVEAQPVNDDELSPLALQMTALDALKVLYRRQEFITVAELEMAVSVAAVQLATPESVA